MNIFGIELTELDLWLLGAVGMGLAWLIPHRLSVSRAHCAELRNAISTFRAAFAIELSTLCELKVDQTGQVHDILRIAYPKHEAAFQEFERNLSGFARLCMRRRWMKYRGPYPIAPELPSEDQRYRLAHFIGATVDEEEAKRNHAIALLTKLTAYSA